MRKYILCFPLAVLLLCPAAIAQKAINQSVAVSDVDNVILPARVSSLFFLDGRLCIAADGMILSARSHDYVTGDAFIDTVLLSIDPEINYAVRNPRNGQLFYTKNDSKGRTFFYEYYEKKPGKWDTRRIKPGKFSFTIENPVFSTDGRAVVFSSDCPLGSGGRDLWYSEFANGDWQYPKNLGAEINTEGDEINPAMCGEFLVYASNGPRSIYGGFDLFASRLVAQHQKGDTVMMFPIGQCQSVCLHAPFCTAGDDISLVVDSTGNEGWFATSDNAGSPIVHFSGRLHCVMLSGVVSDRKGNPVAGAIVTVSQGDSYEVTVPCDRSGRYFLFLQPDMKYNLLFEAPNYFCSSKHVEAKIKSDEMLYDAETYDVSLDAMPIDSLFSYPDMFNSSMGVELSPDGRKKLDRMARFLVENPGLHLTVVSNYSPNQDAQFCLLLNQSRLRSVSDYLVSKGVLPDDIFLSTSQPQDLENVYFIFSR